jgi:type I restriction enzyme R subunit
MKFIKELNDENKRGLKEGLSDEELAIFDLLTKPDMELDNKELQKVKGLARDLLPRAYTKELYQQKCVVANN